MSPQRRPPVLPIVYAVLVVAVGIFTYLATDTDVLGEPDGLAAVFLIVLTLPVSALLLALPVEGNPALLLLIAGGLLQAFGLHLLLTRRRRRKAAHA